jgi:riboflavin biosynthesis pyrimidine reductase
VSHARRVRAFAGRTVTWERCLELGLVDEIWIDLVPVLLGSDVRFCDELKAAPILVDGPDLLVEGSRVTHLGYQVRRS